MAKKGADKIAKKYSSFAVNASRIATNTEIRAVAAERSCSDFYTAEYMKNHIGEEFEGIISGVLQSGFFVELPDTIEGKVDIHTLPDSVYEVENGITLKDTISGKKYTIGDNVKVKCLNANVNLGLIDFELI